MQKDNDSALFNKINNATKRVKVMKLINKSYFSLLLLFISLLAFTITVLWIFSPIIFQYGDNCGYMTLAVAFAKGQGFTDPALPGSFHFLWWPPGFPLFMASFVKLFGPHWTAIKIIILVFLFTTLFFYSRLIYQKEVSLLKTVAILLTLCFSSAIHLLSSYLYSETFFIVVLILFITLFYNWKPKHSLVKIIFLSLIAVYLCTIRLIGICLPLAFAFYLFFFKEKGNKKSSPYVWLIPLILLSTYLLLALFYPPCKVTSLRATIGLNNQFTSVLLRSKEIDATTEASLFFLYWNKLLLFLRGYGLTLIPQAIMGSLYDLFTMNPAKALLMAIISLTTFIGYIVSFKKYCFINCYSLLFMGVLFVYGPHYVRLAVPLVPFLILYFYNGLDWTLTLLFRNKKVHSLMLLSLSIIVIGDNLYKSITNPQKTMPAQFGNDAYQQALTWTADNTNPKDIVVCQTHSYLYLLRGPYCIPYNYATTVNEFLSYLDEHQAQYIVVSPFYHRAHDTYMDYSYKAIEEYPKKFVKVFGKDGSSVSVYAYQQQDTDSL